MRKIGFLKITVLLFIVGSMSACSGQKASDILNPFVDSSRPELGNRNNSAILGSGVSEQSDKARHALEVMGSYKRAQTPQPGYPVRQAAEVRLMWVPDHLNKHGDLIPAHYYYLKVLGDRWAVEDAFDIERQLDEASGGSSLGSSSATPWIFKR